MARKRRCKARVKDKKTGRWRRCKNKALAGSKYCATHKGGNKAKKTKKRKKRKRRKK